jgi:hypothetical protein
VATEAVNAGREKGEAKHKRRTCGRGATSTIEPIEPYPQKGRQNARGWRYSA